MSPFRPFVLQVDNAAAQAFACQQRYAGSSRLRHIDARLEEWVRCLHDSSLVEVVRVNTHDNLADLLTKAAAPVWVGHGAVRAVSLL
jgi:hypothetical protein